MSTPPKTTYKTIPQKTNKAIDWREAERRPAHVAIERIRAPTAGIVDAYCKIELTLILSTISCTWFYVVAVFSKSNSVNRTLLRGQS